MKSSAHRYLVVAVIVLGALAIMLRHALAHDHDRPDLNEWYKSLHSRSGKWCCNEADAKNAESWTTKDGRYIVTIEGRVTDVPDGAIIDGANYAGQAKVWYYMKRNGSELSDPVVAEIRCFMPGSMT